VGRHFSVCSIQGQCAIIMFDVTSRVTYKNVPNWHRDLTRVCENIPIVLCGNKVRRHSSLYFHMRCTCGLGEGEMADLCVGCVTAGGDQGPEGEAEADRVPPEEEPAVLRHLGQEQLQLREALPLARPEAHRVRTPVRSPCSVPCSGVPDVALTCLWLCSWLCSDNELHFVEAPALAPPEVVYDQADMAKYETELTEAAAMPLPDDEDDL
jgi:hypothetical protein